MSGISSLSVRSKAIVRELWKWREEEARRRDLPPRRAAKLGFLGFWLSHAGIMHWFYVVTVDYGGAIAPVGVLAVFAATLYFGIFGAR